MSNSTIADTVRSAAGNVPAGYTDKVDAVIAAVEGLAEQVASALVAKGQEMGASESDLNDLMVEVGLRSAPEPEPEAEASTTDSAEGVAELRQRIERLERAAQRAGVSL